MTQLTGNCLCGRVSFKAEGTPKFMANCHCTDCQQVTGSAFATLVFMEEKDVKVTGATKKFEHAVDSGNILINHFCPNCGAQMFSSGNGRPGMIGLRAGQINDKDEIKPQFNVYASSRLPCTILDENIPAFEKMPN